MMFSGLSAFPLTPLTAGSGRDGIDELALARLVRRLSDAGVDSIGVLGSTGNYAYLSADARARAAAVAVESASGTPVIVGVGAISTEEVLTHIRSAEEAGAAGLLLAPVSYQHLADDEVFGLYEDVAAVATLPIVVYDNPGTTHVTFSDSLHARIAALPGIASIKIPPVPLELDVARARVGALRSILPGSVGIGVSGDAAGAAGMLAGCDAWYSTLGGTLPDLVLPIARAAAAGDAEEALDLSARLQSVWALFDRYGSLRVVSAMAEALGLVAGPTLVRPVRGLDPEGRSQLTAALASIGHPVPGR